MNTLTQAVRKIIASCQHDGSEIREILKKKMYCAKDKIWVKKKKKYGDLKVIYCVESCLLNSLGLCSFAHKSQGIDIRVKTE